MRKLIALLAVVALTAPVFATVTVTCTDEGNGVVQVSYDAGSGPRLQGIALDITVDSGVIVADSVANYKTGESTAGDQGLGIFPGTITFIGDPCQVDDWGTPEAPASDHPDTLDGSGTAGMTVELGALYDPNRPLTEGPADAGPLLTFEVSESCNVSITTNAIRGEIVMSDLTEETLTVDPVTCSVTVGVAECYVIGQPRYYEYDGTPGANITQTNYDAWVAAGKPDCWCCDHHGAGDSDSNGFTNNADYNATFNDLNKTAVPPQNVCGDLDHNGFINNADYNPTFNRLNTGDGNPDCPGL